MTKEEAIKNSNETNQAITHRYFSDDEFIICRGCRVIDEKGYMLNSEEFWNARQSKSFDNDWSIYETKSLSN